MGYLNIIVESGSELSVKNNQLVVNGGSKRCLPIEDINCLLIENNHSVLTASVISRLSESGAAVIFCDEKHMPCACTMSLSGHSRRLKILRRQIEMSVPRKKQLWKQIVSAKIRAQARCLEILEKPGSEHLLQLSRQVTSGDTGNCEATAAAYYFKHLFGDEFVRRSDSSVNAALNYGYAIFRAVIAKHIIAYGMEPALGLHHCNELNAYNLADDIIEPFRPVVDLFAATNVYEGSSFSSEVKRLLVSLLSADIISGNEHHSVSYAMERMVMSLSSALNDKESTLVLPELTELKMHQYE